jgi:secondary thiamine-phosphate synthase enzyme
MVSVVSVKTGKRVDLIDITEKVADAVEKSGVQHGLCCVYVPHTTAAVTVNEHADPDVARDMAAGLGRMVPEGAGYAHAEGNSDAHIKSALLGSSQTLIIESGNLKLGTWQGVFLAEFDGPRTREVWVKVIEG